MYYILFYKTCEGYEEKRKPYREEHLKYALASHEKGELLLAGAYTDPADGAALIFKADSSSVAENFAKNDIYVKSGVVTNWEVRKWNVVIGNQLSVICNR